MEKTDELQTELSSSPITFSTKLGKETDTIMSNTDHSKISPVMKFIREQQQSYLKSLSTGFR